MKKNVILVLMMAVVVGIGYFLCVETQTTNDTIFLTDSSTTTITHEAAKTDEEVRSELIQKGSEHLTELIKEERENKKTKDSILAANRKPYWVYVIGMEKSSPRDFETLYKAIQANVSHLYLFRKGKKNYYLIKNDGYTTEQELIDNKETLQNALMQAGVNESIHIANLTDACDGKKEVLLDGAVKIARGEKIDCYICD